MSREFYVPCTPYAYTASAENVAVNPVVSSDEDDRQPTPSTSISEKIRLKLPDIGNRLKRFITLSNSKDDDAKQETGRTDVTTRINEITDDLLTGAVLQTYSELTINEPDWLDDTTSIQQSDSFVTASSRQDQFEQWIDCVDQDLSLPSTSIPVEQRPPPTSEDHTRGRMVTSTTSTSLDDELAPIISNNTRNFVDELHSVNLTDVLNGAVIIAGDPMDLAAALTAQLGAQSALRRHREPIAIPLTYENPHAEANTDASSNGNTEFSTASTCSSTEVIANSVSGEPAGSLSNPRLSSSVTLENPGTAISSSVISGGVGVVTGMDCMPLRPGPFHYLISEQAKSLVALQELQNEVGALLEFRDLVIETFPNLRHKMAAATASSSAGASVMMSPACNQGSSHIPLPLSSPSSRRITEWEPGKVRRRVAPREASGVNAICGESSSSLPRSRSNSHSGGTKNNCSATVQDSGFSTETSSKDSASASAINTARPTSPKPGVLDEAEDELWNLLDVIHRKGIRLREEVECLQGKLESVAPEDLTSTDVLEAVRKVTLDSSERTSAGSEDEDSQVTLLRREKEQLLDKVAELEAETISSRARAQELQTELAALSALKSGLEDRLRTGLSNAGGEILTPGVQRLLPIAPAASSVSSPKAGVSIKSKSSAFATVGGSSKSHKSRFRTRTIEKNVLVDVAAHADLEQRELEASVNERRARLGALDSVLISPMRVAHVKDVDSRKIEAILRESSSLELQRHLITTTVHNQVLQKRLDEVEKSTETLSERLDKAREENDDLRFQLEERNIELEGTRARVRVLERLQQRPSTENADSETCSEPPRCEQSGPEPGSSTESARDHHQPATAGSAEVLKPSPRRRPSRIPLPDVATTKPSAPRPPSHGRNDSRESLKSLTRPPRDSSRDSHGNKSICKARDSSRDSLGSRSLSKSSNGGNPIVNNNNNNNNNNSNHNHNCASTNGLGPGQKETNRESLNRSLPRNNSSRDSLNKSSSLSRARDSLESSNLGTNQSSSPGTTPPRRPPAPARRSHSVARAAASSSVDTENGKTCTEPPSSWCSSSSSFRHSDSSLYPDSLNQETSSVTGSTRVEFILGSPTRRFRPSSAWPHRYFDSIDSAAMVNESLLTDEFPLRRGEALAECDSLECHPISSEG